MYIYGYRIYIYIHIHVLNPVITSSHFQGSILQQHRQADGDGAVQAILVARAHGAATLLLHDHLVEIGEPRRQLKSS